MTEKLTAINISQIASIFTERGIDIPNIVKDQCPCILIFYIDELTAEQKFICQVSYSEFIEQEFFGTIRRILDWWELFTINNMPSSELQHLLKARSELSRQLEWLGRHISELKHIEGYSEIRYRHERSNYTVIKVQSGEKQGLAQEMANIHIKPLKDEYLQNKRNYNDALAVKNSVEETLKSMASIIRSLEDEQRRANYAQSA